jgi:DNA gyrase subunit A
MVAYENEWGGYRPIFIEQGLIMPDVNIIERKMPDVMKDGASRYANYVTKNRAISDYRDGLLPSHRMILWVAYELDKSNTNKYIKTGKLSGYVIGDYHPHGEKAVVDAINHMTRKHIMVAPLEGEGNFGNSLGADGAAARYTDVRLSKYGRTFVDPEYLNCVPYVKNYTGDKQVPVYLPSLLPNLLFNGTFAIGYGLMACVPSFTRASIEKLFELEFKHRNGLRKEVTASDCQKILQPAFVDKAELVLTDGLHDFYATGHGTIKTKPRLKVQGADIYIVGFYQINLESFAKKLNEHPYVRAVTSASDDDGAKVLVQCTKATAAVIKEVTDVIVKELTITQPLHLEVLTNDIPDGYESDNETLPSELRSYNIPDYVRTWVDYRTALEKRMLNNRVSNQDIRLDRLDALIAASAHIKKIADLLTQRLELKALAVAIQNLLNVNYEQAKYILETPVGRLSRVVAGELQAEVKMIEAEQAKTKRLIANIVNSTHESLMTTMSKF